MALVMMKKKKGDSGHRVTQPQRLITTATSGAGSANLEVFSDKQKVKPAGTSAPADKGAHLTISTDLMGNSNKSEKTKVDLNVRRKALADVSNAQSRSSRSMVCDGSKPPFRAGSKVVKPSSGRSLTGKVKESSRKAVGPCDAASGGTSSNNFCKSGVVNDRTTPMALKSASHRENDAKGKHSLLENVKRISGLPIPAKGSKKVAPRVSTGRNRMQGNRASDGCVIMAPRDQKIIDSRVSSRKSAGSVGNDAVACGDLGTSRSKCTLHMPKQISADIILSKENEEDVTSSLSENILVVPLREAAQGQTSSGGHDNLSIGGLESIPRKRSHRRRSYTALLIAGSKLLEQHGVATTQEKLPSLYDECNILEVAEYADDIYQYYWISEAQSPSVANYMSVQKDITPQMRGILINWLIEVHFKFELMQETLYLTVTLFDQYLSQVQIKKNEMQLVGLTSLLLASKYEDYWHPRIKDLISISAESYTRSQVLEMEKLFLKRLKFRLNAPTPYVFMLRFLKAAKSDDQLEHLSFYLIELSLVEYEALQFKPSLLCASAVYVACSTLQHSPAWTPLLAKYARYEASEIRECAEMILKFQKSAGTSKLRVTYEKYMRTEFSCVAAIMPLDKLLF